MILFKTFTITALIFTLLGICHAQDNDNINLPNDQKKENNTKLKTEEFTAPVLSSKDSIEKIGVELTELIDSIALAEIDQPSRLPIRPIVLKALAAIVNVPEYNLELKMLALTKAQKDEATTWIRAKHSI